MRKLTLILALTLGGCGYPGYAPLEPHETLSDYLLTNDAAGYDQAAYDECLDAPDTTAADCEAIQ